MGVKGVDEMSVDEYRKAAIDAVQQLSVDVDSDQTGSTEGRRLTVPCRIRTCRCLRTWKSKDASVEDLKALFRKLM